MGYIGVCTLMWCGVGLMTIVVEDGDGGKEGAMSWLWKREVELNFKDFLVV